MELSEVLRLQSGSCSAFEFFIINLLTRVCITLITCVGSNYLIYHRCLHSVFSVEV